MEPREADLALDVDPERSRRFRGAVVHRVDVLRPVRRIVLHAAEIEVGRVRVTAEDGPVGCEVRLHPRFEQIELRLERPLAPGPVTIELRFTGRLRGDLRGLYFARSGKHRYALSQMAATHARRVFPCFDEPALKARFELTVTTGEQHTVISNEPSRRVESLPGRRKRVSFERTPLLPTYLLALAIGAFEGSRTRHCGDTPIRVWCTPGRRHLTRFALETAQAGLEQLERYFALPHPYRKLDLVAVPDFEFGAMENAGAVFFREPLLLLDEKHASYAERRRAAEVICHEMSHMWFGNLVTMAWWDDLWLNESFATWMAFHVIDAWKPEWNVWCDYQLRREAALELDALADTHPIYTQVREPEEATANFDLITYEKGAAVVRMVERFLGRRAFRAGVRRYIRAHREGHARSADLWSALEIASGVPIEPIVRAWIEKSGHPRLRIGRPRTSGEHTTVRVRQEPFGAAEGLWPIPLVLRVAGAGRRGRLHRETLRGASRRIELTGPADFVYGNADETCFVRLAHAREPGARLKSLPLIERMGAAGHLWARVRCGDAPLEAMLEHLDASRREREAPGLAALRAPIAEIAGPLARMAGAGAPATVRERLRGRLSRWGEDLPLAARPRDSDAERARRAEALAILGGLLADPSLVAEASAATHGYLEGRRRALDPELLDTAFSLAAREGDRALYRRVHALWRNAETPQERRRALNTLADFRLPGLVDRTLRLALHRDVPGGEVALLLVRSLQNPAAREATWDFVREAWEPLGARMGAMLGTRLIAATPLLETAGALREVRAFFREHPPAVGPRPVRQALERFERERRFRREVAPALRSWLEAD